MNTEFSIKNFRAFDEEGANFQIAPITILTGCNSAGKSSMVKSLLLLDNFFKQMKRDIQINGDCNPSKYRLGITNHSLRLGNFASVLNKSSNGDTISFAYKIKPLIASEPFVVTYTFKADESDALNDGWLHTVEITNIEKELVCKLLVDQGELKVSECNWALLKDSFAQYGMYSLLREFKQQIDIQEELPEFYRGSESEIQHFKEAIKSKESWLKRISSENIKDFNDSFINHDGSEVFDINALDKIQLFCEKNKFLHYLPIFDFLESISKKDVRFILQQNEKAWNADMDAIVSMFEASEFDKLQDFVLELEDKQGLCSVGYNFDRLFGDSGLKKTLINSLTYKYQLVYDELDVEGWESAVEGSDGSMHFMKSSVSKEDIEAKKQHRRQKMPFKFMIETLWKYSLDIDESFKKTFLKKHFYEDLNGTVLPLVDIFAKYASHLLTDMLVPSPIFDKFNYIGSTKAEAQRLYKVEASNMDSFEKTINDYFESKRNHQGDYVPDTFLNKWIRNFNIGNSISIKNTADGLGIVVYLHSSEENKTGHLLADEGYGITQLFSVLLNIETTILNAKTEKVIPTDGKLHGMAMYRDDLEMQNAPATIAIEEPEIHLHPKYQSLLMDMFNDAYQNYNIHFIIETHSEYLVRRSQVLVAEAKYTDEAELSEKCPYKVYYIPQPQEGKPYDLMYKPDGKFTKRFGKGFFDVADGLLLDLL